LIIDDNIISQAHQFKKEADAAYLIFKKEPTVPNAKNWTVRTKVYKDFCTKVITDILNAQEETLDKQEEILANIETYKTCKQCNAELLYETPENTFVASSDFLEDFPGWCYTCLTEHCLTHDCETCTVVTDPTKCSFKDVKNQQLTPNE
jgi:hypothetical protein